MLACFCCRASWRILWTEVCAPACFALGLYTRGFFGTAFNQSFDHARPSNVPNRSCNPPSVEHSLETDR